MRKHYFVRLSGAGALLLALLSPMAPCGCGAGAQRDRGGGGASAALPQGVRPLTPSTFGAPPDESASRAEQEARRHAKSRSQREREAAARAAREAALRQRQRELREYKEMVKAEKPREETSRNKRRAASAAKADATLDGPSEGALDAVIPEFPWPPPRASTFMTLPENLLPAAGKSTLGEVKAALSSALVQGGYSEMSYFSVPSGFALVSRIERIGKDGAPAREERWASAVTASDSTSLFENLRGLLFVRPGFFRILVFVASSEAFTQKDQGVEREQAQSWTSSGATTLPPSIADAPYSKRHSTMALVYEFIQSDPAAPASFKDPGRLSALDHLKAAGVWAALGRR